MLDDVKHRLREIFWFYFPDLHLSYDTSSGSEEKTQAPVKGSGLVFEFYKSKSFGT